MKVNIRSYPVLLTLAVVAIIVLAIALYPFVFPGDAHTVFHTGA